MCACVCTRAHTHTQSLLRIIWMALSFKTSTHGRHSEPPILQSHSLSRATPIVSGLGATLLAPATYILETKGGRIQCFAMWGAFEWQKCLGKRKSKLIKLSNPCSQRTWDSCLNKYLVPAALSIPGLASLCAINRQSRRTRWLVPCYPQQHS